MKIILLFLGFFITTLTHINTWAYEIQTHNVISRAAVDNSILRESGFLENIGYDIQGLPEERIQDQVRDFVANGSKFEDKGTRPRNHFYDPEHDWPLRSLAGFNNIINLGETSPDWALEDSEGKEDIQGQANSYRDALTYFYDALTLPTETERNTQFETLFTTLGQVIHRNLPHNNTNQLKLEERNVQ